MIKLLCATDLLPKSDFAIARAAMLADRLRAEMTLLHVVRSSSSERMLELEIDRASMYLQSCALSALSRHRALPQIEVRPGRAPEVIAQTAQELEAELVIVGPHRTRGMRDSLIGTTMARLLRTRQSPVLLVRREPFRSYRTVLIALDLSKAAVETLRFSESVLPRDDIAVSIVHAFEPPYTDMLKRAGVRGHSVLAFADAWRRREADQVERLLEHAGVDARHYEIVIPDEQPMAAIRHAVNRLDPDLLVVGTRGQGFMRRMLRASIAAQAIDATACDVLVVPQGRESSSHFMLPRRPLSARGPGLEQSKVQATRM